jgi:hypothetical protein
VDYDLFFPPRDVAALNDRLNRALARLDHYRQVAERLQMRVRACYSWPAVAGRFEALYYELAERKRQRSGRSVRVSDAGGTQPMAHANEVVSDVR